MVSGAYSRHPNYFGELAIWWGFFLIALAAWGFWALFSPLLMTFLLLKFSGVALLEKDIGNRRPAYAAYIKYTNAFFPRPQKGYQIVIKRLLLIAALIIPNVGFTKEWNFDVYLDKSKIGQHTFRLSDGNQLVSQATFQCEVIFYQCI